MHVSRLELEDIKSYRQADFRFERGTTAITGENGAGKTTILEAIAWALFDTLDYNKDDFVRRGAKRGMVRVTFESDVDQRSYVVYRDTGNGYYIYDPQLGLRIAEKKADVTGMLRKLLGIEPGTDVKSLFKSAIGVAQGTFTAEFLMPANSRKAAFDRLLKVEEYRESADRLKETANLVRDRINETQQQISNAEGQLDRFDEEVEQHREVQRQMLELENELTASRASIESLSELVTSMDHLEDGIRVATTEISGLEVRIAAARQQLKGAMTNRDDAATALESQARAEPDYMRHNAAKDLLVELETRRNERESLRRELLQIEGMMLTASRDVKRLRSDVERSRSSQKSLEKLAPAIAQQEELERERERLRDLKTRALGEEARLKRIDADLEQLRKNHAQVKQQVKEAEKAQGARERAEKLEIERLGVEVELSRAEQAAAGLKQLRKQIDGEGREDARLTEEIRAFTTEIQGAEEQAALAASAAELVGREQQLTEILARLRAEIERDQKFHSEVKNGLCPILSERCLNIGEGQTLEDYFVSTFELNRGQLKTLELEKIEVTKAASQARDAEKHLGRYESVRKQLDANLNLQKSRRANIAALKAEAAALQESSAKLKSLRMQLLGIDGELKLAREEALKNAQLEPLLIQLKQIEAEGKSKKDERDEVAAAAAGVEMLNADLIQVEERLRALDDPRSRAVLLSSEAKALPEREAELKGAENAFAALSSQAGGLKASLEKRFSILDQEIADAIKDRDATAAGHQEFLLNRAVADRLPEHEASVQNFQRELTSLELDRDTITVDMKATLERYDKEAHSKARADLAAEREHAAAKGAQFEATKTREAALAKQIERLSAIRDSMREQHRELDRLRTLRDTTEFIRDTLKAAGPLVTESYLFNVSVEANQLFREITGEAGRTLRWTRDYEIMVEEDGYERSFTNLSGGEQMAAAMSIRLALLKQLSDIRLAFFDEPTVNMDQERRERLAQQIGQVQHFDQLFVISHDDTFAESVDHIVHVTRDGREHVFAQNG